MPNFKRIISLVLCFLIVNIIFAFVLVLFNVLTCTLGNTISPYTTPRNAALIGTLGILSIYSIIIIPLAIIMVWMESKGRTPEGEVGEHVKGLTLKKQASVALLLVFAYLYVGSYPSYVGVQLFSYFIEPLDESLLYKAPYTALLGAWALVGIVALAMVPVAVRVIASDKELFSVMIKFGDMPRKDKVVV